MDATTQIRGAAGPLASFGAVLGLGAIAAGGCCVLPLAFAAVGLGGSWLGGLTALAPYQPYIVAGAAAVLAAAWFMALRRRAACAAEASSGTCRAAGPRRATYVALAVATKLFLIGAAWPWIEPHLLAALGG
jgi:mercuric ion transport protein